uniref:Uncharacterized protein n=1 Tax=Bartonella rochalimae ATCC BAA-1498 TaxID=685782 RepID=E6YKL9_9HYPH|nr:hypothetical protein BARRO_20064 [Bartonella rochalimae ATCC BAA-1498]
MICYRICNVLELLPNILQFRCKLAFIQASINEEEAVRERVEAYFTSIKKFRR